jgi:DcuC family C4-dicarboxylate transporter
VKLIQIDRLIGHAAAAWPHGLIPAAGVLPMGFGFICGSGIASTESLYAFFAAPALKLGISPQTLGAVVALGSAAGRTMSPVAAVTLMSASLTETEPVELVKRVAPPLLAGLVVVILAAMISIGMGK